jgi:HEPN domain-containing protein
MSPDQDPGRPQAWLRRARSNLARARQLAGTPDVLYEDLCFDAQPVRSATLLTPYAVEARYPGVWEEVTAGDYEQALHVAGQVLAWAEEQVSTK